MRRRLRRRTKFNIEAFLGLAVVSRHPPPLTTSKTVYNSFPDLFSPSSADFLRSLTIGETSSFRRILSHCSPSLCSRSCSLSHLSPTRSCCSAAAVENYHWFWVGLRVSRSRSAQLLERSLFSFLRGTRSARNTPDSAPPRTAPYVTVHTSKILTHDLRHLSPSFPKTNVQGRSKVILMSWHDRAPPTLQPFPQ